MNDLPLPRAPSSHLSTQTVSTPTTPSIYTNQFARVLQDVANVKNHRLIPVSTNNKYNGTQYNQTNTIISNLPINSSDNPIDGTPNINEFNTSDINATQLIDTDITQIAQTQRTQSHTLFQQVNKIRSTRHDLFNSQLHSWPNDVLSNTLSDSDDMSDNEQQQQSINTDTNNNQSSQYSRVWDKFRMKDQHISSMMSTLNTLSAQQFKLQQIIDSQTINT